MHEKFNAKNILAYLKKHWFVFFAVFVYGFFSFYYMGPGFADCNNSIYGFGDSTAGPIWRNSLEPEQPIFGGYQTNTNYPYGENLYSPVGFAASVQSVSMGAMADVVGPVCAYNLYNVLGYITTALVMFFFIRYLTRNKWIALFAGYAVSFTPYVQSKIGGHPNYAFAGILVAIIWLLLHLLMYRKKSTAVILGFVVALCGYIDPYFSLFAITVVAPFVVVWLIIFLIMRRKRATEQKAFYVSDIKQLFMLFGISMLAFLIFLSPLIMVRIKDSQIISQSVGKSRGNVVEAATKCSNMPLDYLLPDPKNTHIVNILGPGYTTKNIELRHWCGYGESRVSISLALLAVMVLSALAIAWEKANGYKNRKLVIAYNTKVVLALVTGVLFTAVVLGLPPYIHGIIMPSGFVLSITEMWRIFTREYLVVNLAVVILSALGLHYFANSKALISRKLVKIVLLIIFSLIVVAEYQINDPFSPPTFNYARDVPSVYKDLEGDQSVKIIAEYPMDRIGVEHDAVVYYMTMQTVHGKSIVNSVLSTDSRETTHIALKDLSDPQTIPALRYLGVQRVIVHGENLDYVMENTRNQLSFLNQSTPVVYGLNMVRVDDNNKVILLKIEEGKKQSNILTIEQGAVINLPLIQSPVNTEYEILNNAVLRQTKLGSDKVKGSVCFDVKMSAPNDSGTLDVYKNDTKVQSLDINGSYKLVKIELESEGEIILKNNKGYNMRLNNLNGDCNDN